MKPIHPFWQVIFLSGGILSFVAGIQLFLLSGQTDIYFAWTIQSPLTAAILGAFFFGTMTFGFLAVREQAWENVRGGVAGLFTLLCIKLAATVLHLDKFHLESDRPVTLFVTWIWLATYSLLPVGVLIGFIRQRTLAASADRPGAALPAWMRLLLLLHGFSGIITGIILFLSPSSILPHWAWTLTPLTARALAAWFLSFGVVDWFMYLGSWQRMRIIAIEYSVSAVFVSIAFARFGGVMDWGSAGAFGLLVYLTLMLVIGVAGSMQYRGNYLK